LDDAVRQMAGQECVDPIIDRCAIDPPIIQVASSESIGRVRKARTSSDSNYDVDAGT
jgi:hypothetical protein